MVRTKGDNDSNSHIFSSVSRKWFYASGLIVVLVTDFVLRDVLLPEQPSDIHIGMALLAEWTILLALLILWIPRVEGHNLGSVGFGKFKRRYFWLGILTYFILLVAWIGSGFALNALGLEGLRSLQLIIGEHGFPIRLSLFLTGALLEEVFYRGYLIERLTSLTGRSWLAGLVSWMTFTFVHLKFFGLGPTLDVGVLSAGLVILYRKERSIWPCIVVHGINDAFGLLIAPLLMS